MVLTSKQIKVLEEGSLREVQQICAECPTLNQEHTEPSMDLPIHIAIAARRPIEILVFLFVSFKACVRVPNVYGQLPLHKALSWPKGSANFDLVRLLTEEDTTTVAAKDWTKHGYNSLHVALFHGCPSDMIRFLANACPQSCRIATSIGTHLPLHVCVFVGAPIEIFRILILLYPKALELPDDRGFKPIHLYMLGERPTKTVYELLGGDKQCVQW